MTETEACSICPEPITTEQKAALSVIRLSCGHCYHAQCICRWFCQRERACPHCRGLYVEREASSLAANLRRLFDEQRLLCVCLGIVILFLVALRVDVALRARHTTNVTMDAVFLLFQRLPPPQTTFSLSRLRFDARPLPEEIGPLWMLSYWWEQAMVLLDLLVCFCALSERPLEWGVNILFALLFVPLHFLRVALYFLKTLMM